MKTGMVKPISVDLYIAAFPAATQALLQKIRATILKAAPDADEVISYQMPAYKQHGMLVFFAAYEHHIGFYPTGSGIEHFKKDIAAFKHSKGAVQFPLTQPLPLQLITKMVKFKVKQNKEKLLMAKSK